MRPLLALILASCLVADPLGGLLAQLPAQLPVQLPAQQPALRPVPVTSAPPTPAAERKFGVVHSGDRPEQIEKILRQMLDRKTAELNPGGNGIVNRSRVVLLSGLTLTVVSTGTTCGSSNGSFSVTATGGTGPYQYSENGYPWQSSGLFTGKAAGSYTITAKDVNGVTGQTTIMLSNTYPQPNPTKILTYTNATGCMGADGSVTVGGTGGTPPYTYSMDEVNYSTNNVFSNLVPGDYSFFVKDANGCVNVQYFPLSRNCEFGLEYSYTQDICPPGQGEIDIINVFNGVAPYSFSKDGATWQSSGTLAGFSVGRHVIYIKDAAGTEMSYSFPMYQWCPLDVTAVGGSATCGNSDGTITATASNGQPDYEYSLDQVHFQQSNFFTNLPAGTYTVMVMDAAGVTASTTVTVPSGCPSVTAVSTVDVCNRSTGTITATGTGGTTPYTFSRDNTNFQNSNVFTGVPAGNYTITIRDYKGNKATTTVSVAGSCPTVSAVPTDPTCGYNNGTITATGAQGQPPYQYSLDNITYESTGVFANLPAGAYTVYVTDGLGGYNTTTVTLTDHPGPAITIAPTPASCADDDGILNITTSGGTAPVVYSIDNVTFQAGTEFDNLRSGTYLVEAKDANGCPASQTAIVKLTNTVTVDAGPDITICQSKTAQLTGQSNGATVSWSPGVSLNAPNTLDPVASPAVTTKYYLTAELESCESMDSVTVYVNPAPVADAGVDTAICLGKSVELGGSGGVAYSWSPAEGLDNPNVANPIVVSPPATVSYSLIVTDGNGCQSLNKAVVEVIVTPTAKVSAGQDTSIAIGEPLPLHGVDVNDSKFDSWVWSPPIGLDNPDSQNPTAVLDESVTYTLTATAPGGCTGEDQIHVSVYKGPDIYVPNAFTPNGDGHNDVLRAIPIGIKDFKYFEVFSRWGQRVFMTVDPALGWDGQMDGQTQPAGTFVWIAEGIDYKGRTIQRKGTTILLR